MITGIYILMLIALVVISIALIVAVFTIKNHTVKQTHILQQQTEILQTINDYAQLELRKNVEKVQLSTGNGKIEIVTVSDWLKRYIGKEGIKIENVS